MSLSVAAAKTELDDVRDDLRDSAALLIKLAMAGSASMAVSDWCNRVISLLDSLDGLDDATISSVRLSVLRLRSTLSVNNSKGAAVCPMTEMLDIEGARPKLDSFGNNPKKIAEFIKANPDVRTRELVSHFTPILSVRTIKRCLKELVDGGILERLHREGAVLYRIQSSGQS